MRRAAEGSDDAVDQQKAALKKTLQHITNLKADEGEKLKDPVIVTMEVETLDDGKHKQFTQIGICWEDKETGVFNRSQFRAILPTDMEEFERNLILKYQINLHSSLKFKHDETNQSYTFLHVKKGDVDLVSEETALKDLLETIRGLKRKDEDVVLFTLEKATFVPLLIERMENYKLLSEFDRLVTGICDFAACIKNLQLAGLWKDKFGDLVDVYKNIMGKPWPKEQRHCDGISALSGTILKKMTMDYTDYLNEMNLNLSHNKLLAACGLQNVIETRREMADQIDAIKKLQALPNKDIKELELKPSDRPGEITIITLKRFECIDVLDVDEVEEEGIKEEDYFEEESLSSVVLSKVTIKQGHLVPITVRLSNSQDNVNKKDKWCLVHKNIHFGASFVKSEDKSLAAEQKKRIDSARQCQVSRQIVQISTSQKPVRDSMSVCEEINVVQIKVLNPFLDRDLILDAGDDIALVRLEKAASPEDPNFKTFSQIKEEALRVSSNHDQSLEEGEVGEETVDQPGEKTKQQRRPSMDLDTISEEESVSEENENEVSLSDIESDDKSLSSVRDPSVEDVSDSSSPTEVEINQRREINPEFHDKDKPPVEQLKMTDTKKKKPAATLKRLLELQQKVSDKAPSERRERRTELRCFPATAVQLQAHSSALLTFILDETRQMGNLLGQKCEVSQNRNFEDEKNSGVRETMEHCSVEECQTYIQDYVSPRSGHRYLSVNVYVRNNFPRKITVTRDVPLVICRVPSEGVQDSLPVPSEGVCSLQNSLSVPSEGLSSLLDSLPIPVVIKRKEQSSTQSPNLETVPTEEQLKTWSVKELKKCLGDAGLNQYGLKSDLVQRLRHFYVSNPSKIPQKSQSVKESSGTEPSHPSKANVNDGRGRVVSITSDNGQYQTDGKPIQVLGASCAEVTSPPALSEIQRTKNVDNEKILKKIGEMKSFEKESREFFQNGYSIIAKEEIRVGPSEKKILTFELGELAIFASELSGRKLLIKERACEKRILSVQKQISSIVINGKTAQVEVLLENKFDKEVVVKPEEKKKLIRVYVEKTSKDLNHQFDIPEDDDNINEVSDLFSQEALNAVTSDDIVLLPKTYHTQTCFIKLNQQFSAPPVGLLERTRASSMQIGMRKMIIIPTVLCSLNTEGEAGSATVQVRMYNASKQTLKVTKKTNIAQVRLQKDQSTFSEKEYEIKPDQRRKYGEFVDGDIGSLSSGQLVLLSSVTPEGRGRPVAVRLQTRSNKAVVPLGSDNVGAGK